MVLVGAGTDETQRSAVLLGIQLLLLMFGADMDFDADTDVDASDAGGFLSLRSLTGFFFGFGWAGVAAREAVQGEGFEADGSRQPQAWVELGGGHSHQSALGRHGTLRRPNVGTPP